MLLGGQPLVCHAINKAQALDEARVIVTSNDDEVLAIADAMGAVAHRRPEWMANDDVPLEPVIADATPDDADVVVVIQPTCPLVPTDEIRNLAKEVQECRVPTTGVLVVPDDHLCIGDKRVNRQQVTPRMREVGVTASNALPRFDGPEILTVEMENPALGLDIDTPEDLAFAEVMLRRKRVVYAVTGSERTGSGHAHNCLMVASGLGGHEQIFCLRPEDTIARRILESRHYQVEIVASLDADELLDYSPDVVINDRLNTDRDYMLKLRAAGVTTINFEDRGAGSMANLCIDALHSGPQRFLAKSEFYIGGPVEIREYMTDVLLAFGGVDEQGYTQAVADYLSQCGLGEPTIHVVVTDAYAHDLSMLPDACILHADARSMASLMRRMDVCITSAGRTHYEAAMLGLPVITMDQNQREQEHYHIGLMADTVQDAVRHLDELWSREARQAEQDRLLSYGIREGRTQTLAAIRATIEIGAANAAS
jgi:spore coat polysaccharide biosynthesis predicted glycosyltransferase SpsG/CTP:molybdopterin cytidylyltransferase MocA